MYVAAISFNKHDHIKTKIILKNYLAQIELQRVRIRYLK